MFLAIAVCAGLVLPTTAVASTNLISSTYNATLTAAQVSGKEHVFGLEGGKTECVTASASATLTAASSAFFLHPTFSGCKGLGFAELTITTTGCDYRYLLGEELEADRFSAQVDLICEAGKQIVITFGACEAQIPAQSFTGTVEVIDDTAASPRKDVSIVSSLEGIDYNKTKDGFLCPFSGTGEKTDGTTTGTQTLTAEDTSSPGVKYDLWVSEITPSTELISSTYDATLTASLESGKHVFGLESFSVECGIATASGTLTAASSAFFLHPAFSECKTSLGISVTIDTTGCDYRYLPGKETKADYYSAQVDLICEAGKQLVITAGTCKAEIPPQSLVGSVEAIDNTAASPRKDISIVSSLEGIDYIKTDGFLCTFTSAGERTDGTTTSTQTLTAEDTSSPGVKYDLWVSE